MELNKEEYKLLFLLEALLKEFSLGKTTQNIRFFGSLLNRLPSV